MKLSVCIQTYNHEPYIAQALDSVLMQKTDFDFEILLGEDDSSDGTREICREYARRHPERIRLFLNSRENVIYINGAATGRWNFMNNLRQARGTYIALLEGDDFWTRPDKLARQCEFLDNHPECSMCFHNAVNLSPDCCGEYVPKGLELKPAYSLQDIIVLNFIPTCGTVARRACWNPLPTLLPSFPVADWLLHVTSAQHGDLGYLNEIMAVRRMHSGGIYSALSKLGQIKINIQCLEMFRRIVDEDLHPLIDDRLQQLQARCSNGAAKPTTRRIPFERVLRRWRTAFAFLR